MVDLSDEKPSKNFYVQTPLDRAILQAYKNSGWIYDPSKYIDDSELILDQNDWVEKHRPEHRSQRLKDHEDYLMKALNHWLLQTGQTFTPPDPYTQYNKKKPQDLRKARGN